MNKNEQHMDAIFVEEYFHYMLYILLKYLASVIGLYFTHNYFEEMYKFVHSVSKIE